MMKHITISIVFIISITSTNSILSQSDYELTKELFDKSELVLQGKIVRMFRVVDTDETSFTYVFAVDSIFKGNPRLYKLYIWDWIFNPNEKKLDSSLLNTTVDAIHFSRRCPTESYYSQISPPLVLDNCFSIGDNLIIFLEDPWPEDQIFKDDLRYSYHIVDLWTGALYPSGYLARYLRFWSSMSK